jgi:hypothetical protein
MAFKDAVLCQPRPEEVRGVSLPRREGYWPSAGDWRDEVLYFLLPDRFSDGRERPDRLLNRGDLAAARPSGFRFDDWARSGGERWQGGTLRGIASKLGYGS